VSGVQMLTVGRGLRTTAIAQWRAFPASGLAAVICRLPCGCEALSSCNGRHKLSADIAQPRSTPPAQHKERHVVTWRYEATAEREARDTRTGLAAEPLVSVNISKTVRGRNSHNGIRKSYRRLRLGNGLEWR